MRNPGVWLQLNDVVRLRGDVLIPWGKNIGVFGRACSRAGEESCGLDAVELRRGAGTASCRRRFRVSVPCLRMMPLTWPETIVCGRARRPAQNGRQTDLGKKQSTRRFWPPC